MNKLFGARFKGMGSVTIDGKSFSGRSIVIDGDVVIVDGVRQQGTLVGPVSVTINGNPDLIETTSGDVVVNGACQKVKTTSGDVQCGDVSGDVESVSGDIKCGKISGNARTVSGDISSR